MRRSRSACPTCPESRRRAAFRAYYPDGPAVAHLVGYVGTANAKEYEAENKNPLLIIPGFKIGKQGLEKTLEPYLRGTPGGQRVEVTARGKLVKELDPKPDRSGQTVQLTIDQGLQQYAARRMGDQSGALVAMDVATGDMLAFVSMPAFDPNSFSDGIGRTEWKMLSEERPHPAAQQGRAGPLSVGIDDQAGDGARLPASRASTRTGASYCTGGYQIGNRYFRCDARTGPIDMRSAIERQLQHLFLGDGPDHRSRENDRNGQLSRLRREVRPAHSDPALRHHAQPRMAGEEIPSRVAGL